MPLQYDTNPPKRQEKAFELPTTNLSAGPQLRTQQNNISTDVTEVTTARAKMINDSTPKSPAFTRAELIQKIKAGEATAWSSRNKNVSVFSGCPLMGFHFAPSANRLYPT